MKNAGRPKGSFTNTVGTRLVRSVKNANGSPVVYVSAGSMGVIAGDKVTIEYFEDCIIIRKADA